MTEPTYTYTLTLDDAKRIVQALRSEAFQLSLESNRACEKGSRDYGTLLWEETTVHNNLANFIDIELPE